MKKRFLLTTSLAMFLGVGVAVGARQNTLEAKAWTGSDCGATWYVIGTINNQSWGTWNLCTLNSEETRYEFAFSAKKNDEFKFANTNVWDQENKIYVHAAYQDDLDWSGKGWTAYTQGKQSEGTPNFVIQEAGDYIFYYDKNITSYENGVWAFGIEKVKTPREAPSSVTIKGSFDSWGVGYAMTKSESTFTKTVSLEKDQEFKIVEGTSTWLGYEILNQKDDFTKNNFSEGAGGNISVKFTGEYTLTYVPDLYDSTGVLTISGELDTVSVKLKVEFKAAVPDYVDIYMPGVLHGWNGEKSLMTPEEGRKNFTIDADAVPDSYEYKLVACYHSIGFEWRDNIDTSNQTLTIEKEDDGTTKVIRTEVVVPNMPQECAPSDAKVTLTFTSKVPSTVNIYFVGMLTKWSNTAEDLASGLMTTDENRLVFTYNIPENTIVGTYKYKIVAMSAYGDATAAAYDYLVYGELASDENLVLNTTDKLFALNALTTDLSGLAIVGFSQGYIKAMTTPCANEDANNKTAVSAIWGTWKSTFEGLPTESKNAFATSEDASVVRARTLYKHCVSRYGLDAWEGAPSVSLSLQDSTYSTSNTALMVIIIAFVTVTSIAVGLYFINRRKER